MKTARQDEGGQQDDFTGLGMRREQLPAGFGLEWQLRLRWLSLAGIVVVCLIGWVWLRLALPWGVLGACMLFMAVSNGLLWLCRERAVRDEAKLIPMLIGADILVLTVMLYYAGGAHNPFTTLYLLHISMAAILLPTWAAWGAVLLCGLGFSLLFVSDHVLLDRDGVRCCDDLDFHLQGMWVAMLITGAGVAYFVTRLRADLQAHRERLAVAKALEERQERFAGLATLAAGVAHELATPLGTIAVVSKDMERQACDVCSSGSCQADAKLIRQEVERCRGILEKLGQQGQAGGSVIYEDVALHEIPGRAAPYLAASLAARVRWVLEPEDKSLPLPVDPLLRVIAVLVKNGCEASAPDAEVVVSLRADTDGGSLQASVSDQGEGMEASVLQRLGEPFFTTKEPGAGMGLGFFLVRTLIENLNGSVSVESTPGKGTSVTLILPPQRECKIT